MVAIRKEKGVNVGNGSAISQEAKEVRGGRLFQKNTIGAGVHVKGEGEVKGC